MFSISANAQFGEKVYYKSPVYIEAGAGYQSYKSNDTTLSALYFPITVMIPFNDELSVTITNNPYMVTRKLPSGDVKVNHLSDTKLNLRYIFLDKRALLNLNANIPSGKTKLELDEFDVFTDLSMGVLKYKVNTLGEGFNIGLGFNYAFSLSKKSTVGAGLSYNNRMEYQPINYERIQKGIEFKYDPSDEIGINLSFFSLLSSELHFSADAYYVTYSNAKINSINVFEPGSMTSIMIGVVFEPGIWQHTLLLNGRIYGDNKQKRSEEWSQFKSSYQLDLDYKLARNIYDNINIFGLFQARMYGEHQDNWNGVIYTVDKSSMLSFGAGLKIPIMPVNITASAKYNSGTIKMQEDMNLSGIDLSIKLSYAF
jgi:hypothetical protein